MMTNLPESDTATKQQELIKLMHSCYPRDLQHSAFPMWRTSSAAEPEWHTLRIEQYTGHPLCTKHATYAEAMEWWRWEWRLLDEQGLIEALALIDEPIPDELPPANWDLFAGAGDMD